MEGGEGCSVLPAGPFSSETGKVIDAVVVAAAKVCDVKEGGT